MSRAQARTAALALLLAGCTVQDVAAFLRAHPRAVAALLTKCCLNNVSLRPRFGVVSFVRVDT
jgi:hypothetical protein